MKIILDFDDAIFNMYAMMAEFKMIFHRSGFTCDEFDKLYKICKEMTGGSFDSELMVDLFERIRPYNKRSALDEINSIIHRSRDFVYADFYEFINYFRQNELILLSFGTTRFQYEKINNSGIADNFGKRIITAKDKSEEIELLMSDPRDDIAFFIDDKAIVIDKVKRRFPEIIAMKIERPQGGHISKKSMCADYRIRDLYEARQIINATIRISVSAG
ncbi:MAG: hypothetical protein WC788_03025 [Candidatus Paceibacterota bacterium]|jgi:FMN phosphatase YigB (HAD superfamily)